MKNTTNYDYHFMGSFSSLSSKILITRHDNCVKKLWTSPRELGMPTSWSDWERPHRTCVMHGRKALWKGEENRDHSTSMSSNRRNDERARPNNAVSNNNNHFPRKAKSLWEMVFKFCNCSTVYLSLLWSVYMFLNHYWNQVQMEYPHSMMDFHKVNELIFSTWSL